MDNLEQQLSAVMNNPAMMQQIMQLAQSMDSSPPQEAPPTDQSTMPSFPDIDLSMIQKLSGFARQSGIDKNQQTLLHALAPYLSNRRISKLERAMRAAKLAKLASSALPGMLPFLTGR